MNPMGAPPRRWLLVVAVGAAERRMHFCTLEPARQEPSAQSGAADSASVVARWAFVGKLRAMWRREGCRLSQRVERMALCTEASMDSKRSVSDNALPSCALCGASMALCTASWRTPCPGNPMPSCAPFATACVVVAPASMAGAAPALSSREDVALSDDAGAPVASSVIHVVVAQGDVYELLLYSCRV